MNKISIAAILLAFTYMSCNLPKEKIEPPYKYRIYSLLNIEFETIDNFGQNYNQNLGLAVFYAAQILNSLDSASSNQTLLGMVTEFLTKYPKTSTPKYAIINVTRHISQAQQIIFSVEFIDNNTYIQVDNVIDDLIHKSFKFLITNVNEFEPFYDIRPVDSTLSYNTDLKTYIEIVWYILWEEEFNMKFDEINYNSNLILSNFDNYTFISDRIKSLNYTNTENRSTLLTNTLAEVYSQIYKNVTFDDYLIFNEIARRIEIASM